MVSPQWDVKQDPLEEEEEDRRDYGEPVSASAQGMAETEPTRNKEYDEEGGARSSQESRELKPMDGSNCLPNLDLSAND